MQKTILKSSFLRRDAYFWGTRNKNNWFKLFLIFLFLNNFSNLIANNLAFLYQSEQAAVSAVGGNFFSYKDNYSSFDTSLFLERQNFYFFTNAIFSKNLQGYQMHSISKIASGNLFIGFGTLQNQKQQNYFFNIGFGKKYNNWLSSGFLLRPILVIIEKKNQVNFSFDYSLRIELIKKDFFKNFAMHSLQLIFGLHNIGISWFYPHLKEDSLLLGLQNQILDSKNFSWFLFSQVGWRINTKNFLTSAGTEFSFHFVHLRFGYLHDSYIKKNMFHLGIGFEHDWKNKKLRFDYTFSVDISKKINHALSINFALHIPDRKPPKIEIKPTENFKRKSKNDIIFKTTLKEKNLLKDWSFSVQNQQGKEVATWRMSQRGMYYHYQPFLFVKDFFQNTNRKFLPKKIIWNFEEIPYEKKLQDYKPDFYSKTESKPLPEGIYSYKIWAKDIYHNKSEIIEGNFYLDRTAPQIINLGTPLVCNAIKNSLCPVQVNVKGNANDKITFELQNSWQKIINKKTFQLSDFHGVYNLPIQKIPMGNYRVIVTAEDNSKNKSEKKSDFFYVQKKQAMTAGKIHQFIVNPPLVPFYYHPKNLSKYSITSWLFRIESLKKNSKRRKPIKEIVVQGSPPNSIHWNGKDFENRFVKDGDYKFIFQVFSAEKNKSSKETFLFSVDRTAPKIQMSLPSKKILSDSDNREDNFIFCTKIQDKSEIDFYRLEIFETGDFEKPILLKTWSGKGMPPKFFRWNLRSPDGRRVSSFSNFFIRLTVQDIAKNKNTFLQKGLKSTINGSYQNDTFIFSIALDDEQKLKEQKSLSSNIKKYLRNTYRYILRYPKYKVRIDASLISEISDVENLNLSENLARLVADFLVKQGLDSRRISFMGMGEVLPMYEYENQQSYANYKNQRIRIMLYQ